MILPKSWHENFDIILSNSKNNWFIYWMTMKSFAYSSINILLLCLFKILVIGLLMHKFIIFASRSLSNSLYYPIKSWKFYVCIYFVNSIIIFKYYESGFSFFLILLFFRNLTNIPISYYNSEYCWLLFNLLSDLIVVKKAFNYLRSSVI